MKINLIGSNGSLASALGRYCNIQGHSINVFGRSLPEKYKYNSFHQLDLMTDSLDNDDLYNADVIIYAAGAGVQSYKKDNSESIYRLNVLVPILLHKNICNRGGNNVFVSFGSYFEIGENANNVLFTEENLLLSTRPVPNDYCVSKRLLTRYFSSIDKKSNFYHFILPTIYGENENENRLIPYLLRTIKNKEKLSFTSGEQIRQYLYVDEVPAMMEKAVNNHIPSGIYNMAGNQTLSVRSLVSMILKAHHIEPKNEMFGSTQRQDVGMKDLQLDGNKLNTLIDYHYSNDILSVLVKY